MEAGAARSRSAVAWMAAVLVLAATAGVGYLRQSAAVVPATPAKPAGSDTGARRDPVRLP
jgi:hypothetical protein